MRPVRPPLTPTKPTPAPQALPPAPGPSRRLLRLLLLATVAAGLALIATRRSTIRPTPAAPETSVQENRTSKARVASANSSSLSAEELAAFTALEEGERRADASVWAAERRAEQRAAWVEGLWERLNRSPDALAELAGLSLPRLSRPPALPVESLAHGIRRWRGGGIAAKAPWAAAAAEANTWHALGWRLGASEWRHVRFAPSSGTRPDTSWFEVHLDLSRVVEGQPARAQVEATLRIGWADGGDARTEPADLEVESWSLSLREAEPAFRALPVQEIEPFPRTSWIDPLVARDLDGDSQLELLLLARNLVFFRKPDGSWGSRTLCARHPGLIFTGVLADLTQDGHPDLLLAVRSGLVLLRGDSGGRFEEAPETVWTAPARLEYAQGLTCGDIDGDGDLDVFLAQYRTPYEGGQMPVPYFDARDGHPSYLLRNDGTGRLSDITAGSGLEPWRKRRTYGATLADLDDDDDLDLLVTSDFAGMEAHLNDGTGRFAPAGDAIGLAGARGFGMSHTLSDFNADGRLDLLMVAMPQPTAERLAFLDLERPGFDGWRAERSRMTAGNRLFLGSPGRFAEIPPLPALARTGWAWSGAAFDLDHDRYPDLHVVNGHETRESVRDYESEFWTRDIYLSAATSPRVADAFFAARFAQTRGRGWSYGGHDRNRLLLNPGGTGFIEVGHLFGVALGEDSRNVLAEDLDGDGDLDLAVTTFETWPRVRQTLRLFENRLSLAGHWVGVRLPEGPDVPSPVGSSVHLTEAGGQRQTRVLGLGDGYRSQGSGLARFGLGEATAITSIEIRYPGQGDRNTLRWTPPRGVDTVLEPPAGGSARR